MKKKLYLLLSICLLLILVGCTNKTAKTQQQENSQVANEADEEDIKKVDDRLKDIDAIKEFLMNDSLFGLGYYEAEGAVFNCDNYVLHHLDFTGDNKLDTILVTYTDEEDYRIVVFLTIENDKYKYYFTDVRSSINSKFRYEDGFLIEGSYGSNSIICKIKDANYFKGTGGGFIDNTTEQNEELCPLIKYKSISTINKIDGYKEFETEYKYYFYDETKKEHIITHEKSHYKFVKEDNDYQVTEEYLVESNLTDIMADNFIIGNDSSLKTFKEAINESNSLKGAIDYYLDNRQKFSKETRISFIEKALSYINQFNADIYPTVEEEITDESILKVTLSEQNVLSIPTNAQDIFKVVKSYYIENGKNVDDEYDYAIRDGYYMITCIDDTYTNKIRRMKFDLEVLNGRDGSYISRDDQYVEIIFDTKENVLKKADGIVYPTILIKNHSQIKELKDRSIWKANFVIIPKQVSIKGN
ncbi:MAG: hypothetical protein N4A63_05800 [Vallitalea sp.]|jgi:hypothetical protein|nr:hypothetical protein [Vallitalea sp.]